MATPWTVLTLLLPPSLSAVTEQRDPRTSTILAPNSSKSLIKHGVCTFRSLQRDNLIEASCIRSGHVQSVLQTDVAINLYVLTSSNRVHMFGRLLGSVDCGKRSRTGMHHRPSHAKMTVQSVGRTILLLCNDDIKRSFAPMRREKSKVRTAGA